MKTYTTIKVNGKPYHYRVTGNRYGWVMLVANDAMFSGLWFTHGQEIKYPFWEQPIDPVERKKFYEGQAIELAEKYFTSNNLL